jgi:hypothetical protein
MRNLKTKGIALMMLFAFAAGIFFAAGLTGAEAGQKKKYRSDRRYGCYSGIIPAASSPGIKMTLILGKHGNRTAYKLIERYLGEDREAFVSHGYVQWDGNGRTAGLIGRDENRRFYIGSNWVQLLGSGESTGSADSEYALRRMDIERGRFGTMAADAASVKKGPNKTVTFRGIMNYRDKGPGGCRSLEAEFTVNLANRTYKMSDVSYYSGTYGSGKLIPGKSEVNGRLNNGSPLLRLGNRFYHS